MNKEQLDKIKRLTGHSYQEIMEMSKVEFWQKITGLLARGVLSTVQYEWLLEQRKKHKIGNNQQLIDTLDVFGGELL